MGGPMIQRYVFSYIMDLKSTLDELDYTQLEKIINVLLSARKNDKQIFILGNGGSAATASHFACDLGKGTIDYANSDFRRFRAISLTDNLALITALGNDLSYNHIFAEQLKNLVNPGDVVIGISASGNSPNILEAFDVAKKVGAITIGFLGFGGGKARHIVDYHLTVSSRNYGISEDFHMIVEHIITQIIRRVLHEKKQKVVFLDRDGIINEKPPEHQYVTQWKDFKFIPEIFDTLSALIKKDYKLVIVTNQQGIGKKLFNEQQLYDIHARMNEEFGKRDIKIEKIYYCPHLESDGCNCRKPQPGMLYRAQNELPFIIDMDNSFILGDSIRDVQAGKAFGIKTVLFNSNGYANNNEADYLINNIRDVVNIIDKF